MLINKFLNKDPDIVPYESPLIIFNSKYSVCVAKNGKETKLTRNIARILKFSKECRKLQNAQDLLV